MWVTYLCHDLFNVFARCKAYFRNRCQQCLATTHAIADACAVVLPQQPWAAAFEGNGFGAGQQQLRASVLRELDIEAAPDLSGGLPDFAEFGVHLSISAEPCVRCIVGVIRRARSAVHLAVASAEPA